MLSRQVRDRMIAESKKKLRDKEVKSDKPKLKASNLMLGMMSRI